MIYTKEQSTRDFFGKEWSAPHIASKPNRKKILLIDNDETFRHSHKELLQNADFAVDTAKTGKEAIIQANFNRIYDLILIDINLPDMNCFSVAAEIRLHRGYTEQKIAILSDTPYISDSMMRDFLLVDISAIITKPFSETEIFKLLNIHVS